jgi:hypothetical protein
MRETLHVLGVSLDNAQYTDKEKFTEVAKQFAEQVIGALPDPKQSADDDSIESQEKHRVIVLVGDGELFAQNLVLEQVLKGKQSVRAQAIGLLKSYQGQNKKEWIKVDQQVVNAAAKKGEYWLRENKKSLDDLEMSLAEGKMIKLEKMCWDKFIKSFCPNYECRRVDLFSAFTGEDKDEFKSSVSKMVGLCSDKKTTLLKDVQDQIKEKLKKDDGDKGLITTYAKQAGDIVTTVSERLFAQYSIIESAGLVAAVSGETETDCQMKFYYPASQMPPCVAAAISKYDVPDKFKHMDITPSRLLACARTVGKVEAVGNIGQQEEGRFFVADQPSSGPVVLVLERDSVEAIMGALRVTPSEQQQSFLQRISLYARPVAAPSPRGKRSGFFSPPPGSSSFSTPAASPPAAYTPADSITPVGGVSVARNFPIR